jgi:N-sulfoglucosamine sulfohydrolase
MPISRRSFLAGAAAAQKWTARTPRPNILLLLADNWAWPHAGCYGDPVVQTPVFDRLAKEGVVFTHSFAPNPSCSPSRSLLLTGQEAHRLGEAGSLYGPLSADVPTYTGLLEKNGYHVGFAGKGWGPGSPEKSGWSHNPAGVEHGDFDAFLKARRDGQPFCFWFGSHDPHVPWNRGQERKSAMNPARVRVPAHLPDRPAVRGDILNYYCEVRQFDFECGQMLAALAAHGELDNTLIVMTSDNGWQIPRGLANCYDLGVRTPLAVRHPGLFKAGQVRDDYVSFGDLAPTFLEAAGLPVPARVTQKSLLSSARRDHMFLERERHANVRKGDLSYPVRGIRTADYLYLRNYEPDRWPAGDPEFYWAVGPYGDVDDSPTKQMLMKERPQPYFDLCLGQRPAEELYVLRNDPDQVNNVAGKPQFAKAKAELAARVEGWMKSTGDPRAANPHTDYWDRAPYSGAKFKGAPPAN